MKKYEEFKDAIGQRESGNNYQIINTLGFLGRFQFGKPRLYDLGFSIDGYCPKGLAPKRIITKEQFLNDPALQDQLFDKHVVLLAKAIRNKYSEGVKKYSLSGLIAGAHLKGLGGVRGFLNGNDNADAYGTKISEYINKFKDYDIPGYESSVRDVAISEENIPKPKPVEKII